MTPMKKILLAIDSFKGCLSSEEVEAAFSQALTARGAEVRSLPMSDGGEGMLWNAAGLYHPPPRKTSPSESTRPADASRHRLLRHCSRRNRRH